MEGWNDPMDLSKFEPSGKLKINLNKRVAYPLNQQKRPEEIQEPLKTLPTVPLNLPQSTSSNDNSQSEASESTLFDPQSAKQKVFNTLEESTKELNSTVQSNVKAKLKALENEWESCDVELQKLLVQLSEYVEQKDGKNAGGIQRKIIMKGYNKPWMQGIRQIIFNLEAIEPAVSTED